MTARSADPDIADDETAFLSEVRAFLEAQLTEDLRRAGRATTGVHSDIDACRIWHRRLYARGWIAPAWPLEHGGTGWTARQRLLFDRECARNDAPVLFAGGLRNVGPLLIARGTAEQRARYLPAILSGEELWCQGYSEPGAGSDLAALRMQATRDGERYIVTGRKIWTTGAQHSRRMFGLVRTARGEKPQDGITFLLIDMTAPGIEVRPIETLYGEPEFNEVVFDGVEVPVEDRVGEENDGWQVAKTLMYFARASNTTTGLLRRSMRRVGDLLDGAEAQGDARRLRRRCGALDIRLQALERLELDMLGRAGRNDGAEFDASMMKLLATELHQDITELGVEIAGPAALERWEPGPDIAESPGGHAAAKYFATRAASIYSGTNEIHRNILGRHLVRAR
jgi:acyl-CoA dehydrogenase